MSENINLKNKLLESSLITKNTIISLVGALLPLIIGLIAIPKTISLLGDDVFGLLIIIWAILSYMSLLDLGLGKALIKYISECIGKNELKKIQNYFWVSIIVSTIFSIILSGLLFSVSSFIAKNLLNIDIQLIEVTIKSIKIISLGVPLIFLISIFNSYLRSLQKFGIITVTQVTNSIFNYVIPVIVFSIRQDFIFVVFVLVLYKILIFIVLSFIVFKSLKTFPKEELNFINTFKELINFGWWSNLSSLISPLIDYMDRFAIASFISLSAVAYYSTPLEIVLRVSFISTAITSVIFSAISNSINHNSKKTEEIINNGLKLIFLCTLPIIYTVTIFAEEGLRLWVGDEFAREGFFVVQIIGIGILYKSVTHLPIAHLHSLGKPSLVATVHMFEVPIYISVLYILSLKFGLVGAAIAHSFRLVLDYILMTFFARKNSRALNTHYKKYFFLITFCSILISVSVQIDSLLFRLILWGAITLLYMVVIFRIILNYIQNKKFNTMNI
ncbi:MAG: oligosaccharide flippase family protein [Balneolaceae bacterium]